MMNLQKKYTASMKLFVLQFLTGRWAVSIINIRYSQNQMNDCLNWCVFLPLCFVSLLSRVQCQAILAACLQSTGDDKVAFPTQQLLTQSAKLARWVPVFLYEYPGTLNQQKFGSFCAKACQSLTMSSDLASAVLSVGGYQPCCRRKVTAAGVTASRRQSQLK